MEGDRGRGSDYIRSTPTASKFHAPQRKTRSATSGPWSDLFNYLIGAQQGRCWQRNSNRLCSLQVDCKLERSGCSTGRSAGFAPRKIFATNEAPRRITQAKSTP
jgi:hypothetical protein